MTLQEILVNKGYLVHTITPDASMADVVDMLTNYNVGSLVVVEDGQMVGIITERDVLRCLAAREASLEETRVGDRMTEGPICGELQHGVEETMGLLTQYRIRHLPVIDGRSATPSMSNWWSPAGTSTAWRWPKRSPSRARW